MSVYYHSSAKLIVLWRTINLFSIVHVYDKYIKAGSWQCPVPITHGVQSCTMKVSQLGGVKERLAGTVYSQPL